MGSSAKRKREKKSDFAKPKLKVGKARPKNTNATDTSFAAKSIVLKQQILGDSVRDPKELFDHNLSILSSKNDTQRRDALQYLTTTIHGSGTGNNLPQPASAIVARAQSLILDGSAAVRSQLLKLLKVLSKHQIGSLDQVLLYARAGMTHLSTDIRLSSLDVMDWLLDSQGEAVMACPGGWIKTLQTFQNLLSWQSAARTNGVTKAPGQPSWSHSKTSSGLASPKLLVRQLTTLSHFLAVGLTKPAADPNAAAKRAAELFPLWHTDAHLLPKRSKSFGYLNLFGAPRDAESEAYEDADERVEVFNELELLATFRQGVTEAKKEGGEVGRAAAGVEKALRLAELG